MRFQWKKQYTKKDQGASMLEAPRGWRSQYIPHWLLTCFQKKLQLSILSFWHKILSNFFTWKIFHGFLYHAQFSLFLPRRCQMGGLTHYLSSYYLNSIWLIQLKYGHDRVAQNNKIFDSVQPITKILIFYYYKRIRFSPKSNELFL